MVVEGVVVVVLVLILGLVIAAEHASAGLGRSLLDVQVQPHSPRFFSHSATLTSASHESTLFGVVVVVPPDVTDAVPVPVYGVAVVAGIDVVLATDAGVVAGAAVVVLLGVVPLLQAKVVGEPSGSHE